MEKKVEISMLCEMYGKLLTEKQYIFIEDYYNNDLSLSEIAENENITRQAVRDIIKKAENKLMEMEDKLGLMKKQTWQKKQIEIILNDLKLLQGKNTDKETEKVIKDIYKKINCLV